MARRPQLGDDPLWEIATYLARPETRPEFHAELHPKVRAAFEVEYAAATDRFPLPPPARSSQGPYYVWDPDVNKFGRQLRIYFARVEPEPPMIRSLYTDYGVWHARQNRYRINHSNLVMQLFGCGFVLGANQDPRRIKRFMRRRFPVRC